MSEGKITYGDIKEPLNPFVLQNYLEMALEDFTPTEILDTLQKAIERKAYRKTDEWQKEFESFTNRLNSGDIHKDYGLELPNIKGNLKEMEDKCKWVKETIQKDELTHLERTTLLFLYLRYGEEGEKRLIDIMKRQKNFRQNITNAQINQYRKKKKFGITCKKIKEWGLCKYEC